MHFYFSGAVSSFALGRLVASATGRLATMERPVMIVRPFGMVRVRIYLDYSAAAVYEARPFAVLRGIVVRYVAGCAGP